MERTVVLPHIKQTSYMKKLLKIFTTLKDTLKLTRFCVLLINRTTDVKHNWKSQGNRLLEITGNLDSASYTLREQVWSFHSINVFNESNGLK